MLLDKEDRKVDFKGILPYITPSLMSTLFYIPETNRKNNIHACSNVFKTSGATIQRRKKVRKRTKRAIIIIKNFLEYSSKPCDSQVKTGNKLKKEN